MDFSYTRGSWDDGEQGFEYTFHFEWQERYGDTVRFILKYYHGGFETLNSSYGGVYDEEFGTYFINMRVYLPPFYKLEAIAKASSDTSSFIFTVPKSIYTPQDSYLMNFKAPIHTQWVTYKNARYLREANSCVANAICSGIDENYYNYNNKLLRPSVGYLYGAVHQDKDENYGMMMDPTFEFVMNKGIANADLIIGDAKVYRYESEDTSGYPNGYLKRDAVIETSDGKNKNYEGAVTIYNKNIKDPNVLASGNYAKISSYTVHTLNNTNDLSVVMRKIKQSDCTVLINFGIENAFDLATINGGVVGRLLPNSRNRFDHVSHVVGWKIIGDEYYWIIKNSWGKFTYQNGDWVKCGDGGLFYMPFSWISPGGNIGGLYRYYSFIYKPAGEFLMPKPTDSPVLDTEKDEGGRGNFGKLYLKIKPQREEILKFEISGTNESGQEKIEEYYARYYEDGRIQFSSYLNGKYQYGETLKLKLRYKTLVNVSQWSNINLATTLPCEPVIKLNSVSTTSATIGVSVAQGKYTDIAVHRYVNGVYKETRVTTTSSVTFPNLNPNEVHSFNAETRLNKNGTILLSYKKSNSIDVKLKEQISKFYWTTNIATGNSISNNTGSDNKWYAYPITSTEWKSYIDTLKKCREIKNITTNRPLSDASRGTKMIPLVNQAINALNDMLPSGKMSTLTSTSTLTSRVFLDLQNKLNSVIDTIL